MPRYIDADRFIEWLDVGHLRTPYEKCHSDYDVKEMIDSQQTAEVQEVRRGKWVVYGMFDDFVKCSCCGYKDTRNHVIYENLMYCGKCGANMDEEEHK